MRLLMSTMILAVFLIYPSSGTAQVQQPLSAAEIFQRVEQENVRRAATLRSYTSVRSYSVSQPGKVSAAEMVVECHYAAPAAKKFNVVSQRGVGIVHKRVFRGVMDAELEASGARKKADSSISPANYDVELIGEQVLRGRDAYVLELKPKRQEKFLLRGKIWVDRQDFAIMKLEGDPVKNPSFWVSRVHIVREYQKVGEFWIAREDETYGHVRFAGDYVLRVNYTDYTLNGEGLNVTQK